MVFDQLCHFLDRHARFCWQFFKFSATALVQFTFKHTSQIYEKDNNSKVYLSCLKIDVAVC
jgi:hypothetical protein